MSQSWPVTAAEAQAAANQVGTNVGAFFVDQYNKCAVSRAVAHVPA